MRNNNKEDRTIVSEIREKYMIFTHCSSKSLIAIDKSEFNRFVELKDKYGIDFSMMPDNETIYGYLLTENEEKYFDEHSLSKSKIEFKINELDAIGVWML